MKLIILVSYNWGANEAKYTYDEAGQLIREDNQGLGKSWTWAYDLGGNILEKKEYAYTTGELGEAQDTIVYGYGNGQWRYTWQEGRDDR